MGTESEYIMENYSSPTVCDEKNFLNLESSDAPEQGLKRSLPSENRINIIPNRGQMGRIMFGKNPVSILNQLFATLKFEVESVSGSHHKPHFVMSLTVRDLERQFTGAGPSKKIAKHNAANSALTAIFNVENNSSNETQVERPLSVESNGESDGASTSSSSEHGSIVGEDGLSCYEKNLLPVVKRPRTDAEAKSIANGTSLPDLNVKPGQMNQILQGKNPVSILNELFTTLTFEVQSVAGLRHKPIFVMSLKVKDIDAKFTGSGMSKKIAKHNAAISALSAIFNLEDKLIDLKIETNVVDNDGSTIGSSDEDCVKAKDDLKTDIIQAKRKLPSEVTFIDKNPVCILNELRVGLKYEIDSVTGPAHNPLFNVWVEVDGQKYYGSGASKKIARAKAAEEALKSFIQFPNNGVLTNAYVGGTGAAATNRSDFTSDDVSDPKPGAATTAAAARIAPREKNPVMLLNELYPNAVYTYTHNETDIVNRFTTTIAIDNEEFYGTGSSKRNAKSAAAKNALAKLINYIPNAGAESILSDFTTAKSPESILRADGISRMVNQKFMEVMEGDVQHTRRKVLAGIVMTRGPTLEDAEVICVTTGTKCVSGGHICLNGSSLNDMHAEITARRCLLSYLYDQLYLLTDPGTVETSIFEPRDDKSAPGGYKLKEGVEFHLYINTAPCGDARIFSPHEDSGADRHPNRTSRGQLRTKIESGEGTIPIKGQPTFQTWDGIIQGERLLTMSCSDKICKWNVVGLQGALLSHFIEPIYLRSLVLGGLMNDNHLYRALCGRIESTLQGLPPPYQLNRLEMLKSSSVERRQAQKAPSFAVIWMQSYEKPEILSTERGKPDIDMSMVCKQKLAQKFHRLIGHLTTITGETVPMTSYADAKHAVTNYTAARQALYDAFKKAQLGSWVTMPLEQDHFEFQS